MEQYVALDVSLKEVSLCVIDGKGAVTFEGKVAAEPAMPCRDGGWQRPRSDRWPVWHVTPDQAASNIAASHPCPPSWGGSHRPRREP